MMTVLGLGKSDRVLSFIVFGYSTWNFHPREEKRCSKLCTTNSSRQVWQEHHDFTHNTLKNLAIGKTSFAEKIQQELAAVCKVLDGTEDGDMDPAQTVQTAVTNIVCSIAFGSRFDYDDPAFNRVLSVLDENLSCCTRRSLLGFFPFLRYMPGDVFKTQRVLKNVDLLQTYLRQWLDSAKRRFNPSDIGDFMDAYFKEMSDKKSSNSPTTLSHEQLLKLMGDLLVGGTKTTTTTLLWVIIFLVRWPHVQRKLRQEIDKMYPDKTTPSVQDRHRMPYTEATILECQRFADVTPFSLTHAPSQDVEVEGHRVPKGSIVIPNVHSVHHDANIWGDPENFLPERFLNEEGEVVPPEKLIPFFIGNRSCPGAGLARIELFLFITTIVQRYEIRPASKGKLPSLEGHVGIAYSPNPFAVRFYRRERPPEEDEFVPKEETEDK